MDQDVFEEAAVTSFLHEIGRPVDRVVEVDFASAGERFLVALEEPPEHRKKRLRLLPLTVGFGAFGNVLEGQPAAALAWRGCVIANRVLANPVRLVSNGMPVANSEGRLDRRPRAIVAGALSTFFAGLSVGARCRGNYTPNRSCKFIVGPAHPGSSSIVSFIVFRAAATISSSSAPRLSSSICSRSSVAIT